jgi:hypothetical protein
MAGKKLIFCKVVPEDIFKLRESEAFFCRKVEPEAVPVIVYNLL